MTIPGKRPATKLFPENSSANRSAVSVISISSRVLGEVDAVADGEDCETTSSVAVALRELELVDNAELVGVVVAEEVVGAAWIAHIPLWQVAPGGQHESPHWSSCVVGSE